MSDNKCPDCGNTLHKVTYPGGYLNPDQWDSVRAGDWYCETCPPNGRSRSPYRYFWNHELTTVSTTTGDHPNE